MDGGRTGDHDDKDLRGVGVRWPSDPEIYKIYENRKCAQQLNCSTFSAFATVVSYS